MQTRIHEIETDLGTVVLTRRNGRTSARAVRHETTVTLAGTVRQAVEALAEAVEEGARVECEEEVYV
jgi:hypothetical protein